MGMAASQARLLTLQARQSDLEYQGQQINQERSVLSQQVTALYNSLLTMTVPTPPSTSDYTTVQYAGTIGATAYVFDASSVKPGTVAADGTQRYIVTVKQNAFGDSLDKNPNVAVVDNNSVTNLTAKSTKVQDQNTDGTPKTDPNGDPVMVYPNFTETEIKSGNLFIVKDGVARAATENDFTKQLDGSYKYKDTDGELVKKSDTGVDYVMKGSINDITVDGEPIYTLASAEKEGLITEKQRNAYRTAIEQSGIVDTEGKPYTENDFYIYFNDDNEACFVLTTDIGDRNDNAVTYTYIANGNYKKNTTYTNCKLKFDPTSGRITSISMPNYKIAGDETSEIVSWTNMEVAATTVSDDMAYEDAYNQYEYAKFQYDKKQQEINAQTEVIQQMDRNLELKLQRLDNEREQITNEVEALDKVISENIQNSYKTFSG